MCSIQSAAFKTCLSLCNNIAEEPMDDTNPNIFNMGTSKKEQDEWMDKIVYRVMKLEYLLNWCDEKKNVLPSVDKWDDPWERALFKNPIKYGSGWIHPSNFKYYGQCWSFNEKESDATWRIFKATEGGCVRVGVKAGDLYNCLTEYVDKEAKSNVANTISCYAGKVEYKTPEIIAEFFEEKPFSERLNSTGTDLAETLFVKREKFAHEEEFRVLYFPTKNDVLEESENNLTLPLPDDNGLFKYGMPVDKIVSVLFCPEISHCEHELEEKKNKFEDLKKSLQAKGIIGTIERSDLYDFPLLNITY